VYTCRNDYVNLEPNKIVCEFTESLRPTLSISVLDGDIPCLDVTQAAQPCRNASRLGESEEADPSARKPTVGTFFGCCAWAGMDSASTNSSVRRNLM
jgi:hypothetical protein